MEFDPSFQGPQHLPYLSSLFPENPNLKPHTQAMFPSQSSILIPPSPPSIMFHPFQDHIMNAPTQNPAFVMEDHSLYGISTPCDGGPSLGGFVNVHRHHPMMLAPNNNNALHDHYKGKVIWDFSQKTMVHQSEASSSRSSPSPISLSNEYGFLMSEYHWDTDQRMQQKMRLVKVENDTNIANGNIIKGQWSPNEDSALVELVKQFGLKKWSHIANLLHCRIGKQCRERWHNHLRPDIKKEPWTLEEDMILIEAHQEVGNKWSEIAKRLSGRTENTIKNHWNATKRRQNCRRHSKNRKSSYEGSVLHAYVKRATAAAEEAAKAFKKSMNKKNKRVRRCNCDELALMLSCDHCSHDRVSGYAPKNADAGNVDYGAMAKDAMKRGMNQNGAKY